MIHILAERHELAKMFLKVNGIAPKDAVVMTRPTDVCGRRLACTVYVVGYPMAEAVVEVRRRVDAFGGSIQYVDAFEKVF